MAINSEQLTESQDRSQSRSRGAEVVPAIGSEELPVLSRAKLGALHFGEGCLIEEYLFLRNLAMLLQPGRILEVKGVDRVDHQKRAAVRDEHLDHTRTELHVSTAAAPHRSDPSLTRSALRPP